MFIGMFKDCEMTRNMPIGAFVVFVGALLIFCYVLFDDYQKTNNDRSTEDNVWITIFFVILILSVLVSGICVVRLNKTIGSSNFGKKVNKKLDLLRDSFNSSLPVFVGKKRVK